MKIVYTCEKCGNTWETEAKAAACEKYHVEPTTITYKYNPGGLRPRSILCEFGEIKIWFYASEGGNG